jgi:excinuclease ABC subunit B
MKFKIKSKFKPTGDQPQAIEKLTANLDKGVKKQVLLGVTGSGKTFTMANVIEKIQKPTLVIAHNKTLAAQLYSEFKQFFPNNAVHYFVSYYDYYQPEAYIPHSDTYIEKETDINEEIDKLRSAATAALMSRNDVIIVASVSCIYGLGNPLDYAKASLRLAISDKQPRNQLLKQLIEMRYERNDVDFWRGKIRVRGENIDIFPAYEDFIYRLQFFGDTLEKIYKIDYLTGEILEALNEVEIFPAKHFVTSAEKAQNAFAAIRSELAEQIKKFKAEGKLLEAQRIEERTNFDLEMMQETGYCNGIENYSRHLDGRSEGEPPACLLDYFPRPKKIRPRTKKEISPQKDEGGFLCFIDESHMTIPQIQGMYRGDRARKQVLIDYGFRLPSALDNRPLTFNEFESKLDQTIYVSATPGPYELSLIDNRLSIVEQIVRPTGLLDPIVEVRPTEKQIEDLFSEIKQRVEKHQRVLVTTLTKRLAEDFSEYLMELGIKVHHLHSEIDTLERTEILRDLRAGKYDVLVGINLLREGLDLPEVSLVAILDADKEGFLRSETSLIQTFGRAARHADGRVIMYADKITESMKRAIDETNRRRKIQEEYNKKHHIKPKTIIKEISYGLLEVQPKDRFQQDVEARLQQIPEDERKHLIKELTIQMELAASNLEFERAARLRDQIKVLKNQKA